MKKAKFIRKKRSLNNPIHVFLCINGTLHQSLNSETKIA